LLKEWQWVADPKEVATHEVEAEANKRVVDLKEVTLARGTRLR